jgi:uncharacterized caspase-like protein
MPPVTDPPAGSRQALVIATGMYADAGLRLLRAPARDAADLALILADPGIGGFAVTTVTQQVRLAIEDFLADRGTGGLLLVYLSCHGLLDAAGASSSPLPIPARTAWRRRGSRRPGCWTSSSTAGPAARS